MSKIPAKFKLSIESIEGQGVVSAKPILNGLKALKADLESKGYEVSITVGGHDISDMNVVSLTPLSKCQECEGTGRTERDEPCKWCNGTGSDGEWL